jgi:hypothetical protein
MVFIETNRLKADDTPLALWGSPKTGEEGGRRLSIG